MKWSELIAQKRLGGEVRLEEFTEEKYPRSEFEKDYRRIISTASFRRLQDKTQVFPLDKSDFVRTRLTHSYETAAIAEMMGTMLLTKLKDRPDLDDEDRRAIKNIPDVLACAGLLHDIGNPPFGHFGEEVIQKWFQTHLPKLGIRCEGETQERMLSEVLREGHQKDLAYFDGNAQGFRLASKLHYQDGSQGLNLTAAVLNTLVKYPANAAQVKDKADDAYNLLNKKVGYFSTERGSYARVATATGVWPPSPTREEVDGIPLARHPLAYVLEAADDIAYRTADIEDGLKKRLFTMEQLIEFVNAELKERWELVQGLEEKGKKAGAAKERRKMYKVEVLFKYLEYLYWTAKGEKLDEKLDETKMNTDNEKAYIRAKDVVAGCADGIADPALFAMQNWIPYAQEWLMYCAVYGFDSHYNKIMRGGWPHDLLYGTNHEASMEIIYAVMEKFIFPNREILKLELGANTILSGLLDRFVPAVLYHDRIYQSDAYVEDKAYERLWKLVSDNYRGAYMRDLQRPAKAQVAAGPGDECYYDCDAGYDVMEEDIYCRLLLAADYVSGMTDFYARAMYQELNGQELTGIF